MRFLLGILLICFTAMSLAYEAPTASTYFEKNGIIPEVIVGGPVNFIKVLYEHNTPADKGTTLSPSQVKRSPAVTWEAGDDDLYTLIMIDADATPNDESDSSTNEFLHWLIANIPINNLCNGQHFATYLAPFPERGTGYHRYVFLAYQQPKDFLFNINPLIDSGIKGRENFSAKNFSTKFELGDPVAGNLFLSKYDDLEY